MDKEIIIDGVNVAECVHIFNEDNKPKTCYIDDTLCVYNHYCYFKQLAREKQNNAQLQKENYELDGELEETKQQYGGEIFHLNTKVNKYEKALNDIKDYCNRTNCEYCPKTINQDVGDTACMNCDVRIATNFTRFIINKINEVLNEN